jgi:hypothetical protein
MKDADLPYIYHKGRVQDKNLFHCVSWRKSLTKVVLFVTYLCIFHNKAKVAYTFHEIPL